MEAVINFIAQNKTCHRSLTTRYGVSGLRSASVALRCSLATITVVRLCALGRNVIKHVRDRMVYKTLASNIDIVYNNAVYNSAAP